MKNGHFIISLDYELAWGIIGYKEISEYKQNLLKVPTAIDQILELFSLYDIACTWAYVGLLHFKNWKDLKAAAKSWPKKLYTNTEVCPLTLINKIDVNADENLFFDKGSLDKIINTPRQYLSSHSFFHIYTNRLNDRSDFIFDDKLFKTYENNINTQSTSYIFPQNRISREYLDIISNNEYVCYRGHENSILYNRKGKYRILLRLGRFLDSIFNVTGDHIYRMPKCENGLVNLPSSRLLSPTTNSNLLTKLRLRRIKKSMTRAAKKKLIFHLWWHPHNFGNDVSSNMDYLKAIILHYKYLSKSYGFKSVSMEEFCLAHYQN